MRPSILNEVTPAASSRGSTLMAARSEVDMTRVGSAARSGAAEPTRVMSTSDLAAISVLPRLLAAGVTSFKIEGRMKDAAYVGVTTAVYREALDAALADPEGYEVRRREAPREALLEPRTPLGAHLVAFGIGERRVQGLAVHDRGNADVGGVFHAALDLERGDPRGEQPGQHADGGEVGGGHDTRGLGGAVGGRPNPAVRGSVAQATQVVAQAAGLAAAPTVAAAAADHARQQAIAGVAVAERPVDEGLELEAVRLELEAFVHGALCYG